MSAGRKHTKRILRIMKRGRGVRAMGGWAPPERSDAAFGSMSFSSASLTYLSFFPAPISRPPHSEGFRY